jgi:hypothetical protein
MLYLLSISVTLVGAATLVALILFSNRNDDQDERYQGGEGIPFMGSLPPAWSAGDESRDELPRGGDPREKGSPSESEGPSVRDGDAGFPRSGVHPGGDGAGTRTSASGPPAAEPAASIPILRPEAAIPGLGKFELVHFLGKAGLGTLEDQRELQDVQIEGNGPQLELQGEIAITSKHIIVFDAKTSKKIPFGVVEAYRFHGSFLLIKKKNVKTKKTLLKIFGNVGDFQYILGALIPL